MLVIFINGTECLKGIKFVEFELINIHQKVSWKLFFLYFYIKCTGYMNNKIYKLHLGLQKNWVLHFLTLINGLLILNTNN